MGKLKVDEKTGSLESGHFRRGPGGRPSRQEAERRHRELLTVAKRLLLERGWDATSIDEISRQSAVAKRFIYARYPDKAALFIAAAAQFRDDQISVIGALDALPDDVEAGLLGLGRNLLAVALRDEALAMVRLFLTEGHRLGEHAKSFAQAFPQRALSGIVRVLAFYAQRGDLTLPDAQIAAEHFVILVVGLPQRRAMLGYRETPEQEEERLRSAIRLFLHGTRRQQR